jgi:GT2 family glycosyltransferase
VAIPLDENTGFATACNIGVRESRFSGVVLLNPDTQLVDSSLEDLADYAIATNALVGPEVLNEDRSRQPSASTRPGHWEVALDALFPARLMPRALRHRCEPWRSARRTEVGWLTGACIAAPRDLLRELGPFHESLHLFGEDMELGLRASELGVRSIYAPDLARVVHLGGASSVRRFADGGQAAKIRNRRIVVRERVGRGHEYIDLFFQLVFFGSRYVAKRILRDRSDSERSWLVAFVMSRGGSQLAG